MPRCRFPGYNELVGEGIPQPASPDLETFDKPPPCTVFDLEREWSAFECVIRGRGRGHRVCGRRARRRDRRGVAVAAAAAAVSAAGVPFVPATGVAITVGAVVVIVGGSVAEGIAGIWPNVVTDGLLTGINTTMHQTARLRNGNKRSKCLATCM